jgi:60 kDa SS-A/Ro ribonucleoprotein
MKLNKKPAAIHTHQGAKAQRINPEQMLRRSVMSCMLWEKTFYEDGKSIAERIAEAIPKVDPKKVVKIAIEAREKMHLRHVPLLIVREMARHPNHKRYVSRTLQRVIKRPDELTEFLSIYWKDGKCPLSAKVKQGLAFAFHKFNEYQLAKYNRDGAIKLRDVLFLSHSKPKDEEADKLYKKLVNSELTTPDTWEVALSGGADKKATFEKLMSEKKLGALAFIRNLRNMGEADVSASAIKEYAENVNVSQVLPFQFIAAANTNLQLEPLIEKMMFKCLAAKEKLPGHTTLLVDVSGSMYASLSEKSTMNRWGAACGVAILLRQICDEVKIYSFSDELKEIPLRQGFALKDAIINSQPHGGTALGRALRNIDQSKVDRLIVITDEQSSDKLPSISTNKAYMINVAPYQNGIGYGQWKHLDGFSSSLLDWIAEYEKEFLK